MNAFDTRRFEMLSRVAEFGATHTDTFPSTSLAGKLFAEAAASVQELRRLAASQVSGISATREGATTKAAARAALREQMDAISNTARSMALVTRGLDNKFRLPRSNGDQAILAAARAFADDAVPLKDVFAAHEMPSDFLRELQTGIDNFEQAIKDHGNKKGIKIAATAAIDDAMEKGLIAVQRLDGIIPNKLRDDPATFATWQSARRVERAPRFKNAVAVAPAATLSPAATK